VNEEMTLADYRKENEIEEKDIERIIQNALFIAYDTRKDNDYEGSIVYKRLYDVLNEHEFEVVFSNEK